MFQLSDFYGYCKQNDVDVMPFAMLPRAACTVRDGQNYAVVLNFKRLHTVRQMRTAMLHESGHLHTGALHKVNSPFQLVEQNEYRADADAFRRCLPPDEIRPAQSPDYGTGVVVEWVYGLGDISLLKASLNSASAFLGE